MIFQSCSFWLSLVFGLITCSSKVGGLKCYICNIETDGEGCMVSVSTKSSEFLKECHPSAETCATFTVEPFEPEFPPFKRWFQRTCVYRSDRLYSAFSFFNFLPGRNGTILKPYYGPFIDKLIFANSRRWNSSLPLMQQPSESFLKSLGERRPEIWLSRQHIFIQTCEEGDGDGCNSWDGRPLYPHAEGFPFDDHKDRITIVGNMKCYSCSTGDFPYDENTNCLKTQTFSESTYKRILWSGPYGCATLSIYQIAGGRQPYFERNGWLPGDSWCLEKRYASSPTARSLVQYMNKKGAGGKDGGRSGKESCREGYTRALKKRNSKGRSAEPFSDEENYVWAGKREFVSVEEFSDFLECRKQVRERMGVSDTWNRNMGNVEVDIVFFKDDAKIAFAGKSGPFASVGFHFCGPFDYCNDWSEEHLQEVLENPPPRREMGTKPPTTTTTSATTTPPPTTLTIHTTTPLPLVNPERNKTEGVSTKEIPEGCEIQGKNSGESLDRVTFIGIFSILVIVQAMECLLMK